MRIITLTTDFGLSDWFVGAMKGAIFSLNSRVQIVDVSHAIPSGDIRAGAFVLAAGCTAFPKGTIHLAVVDPGVGSARNAIAVETGNYIFLGPDNGVLSLAVDQETLHRIHRLEDGRYFRDGVSNTFHGRDILAPVAGHLTRGVPVSRLGPVTPDFVKLNLPKPCVTRNAVRGEVVYLDHFGNAITNIHSALFRRWSRERTQITVGRNRMLPLSKFYAEVKSGWPLALVNSAGLEVAVNRGHAARCLRLKMGSPVVVRQAAK